MCFCDVLNEQKGTQQLKTMSAKMKPKKSPEDTLDMKMDIVLVQISEIDSKIDNLKKRRQVLVAKYEEFKEAKMIKDSQAVSLEQDWDKGKSKI